MPSAIFTSGEGGKQATTFFPALKFTGIVSRDWGGLEMIPVDRSEVFSVAG